MEKKILDKIDGIINLFKSVPATFDNNIWRCYSDCKQCLHEIAINHRIYEKYIDYITEKLELLSNPPQV